MRYDDIPCSFGYPDFILHTSGQTYLISFCFTILSFLEVRLFLLLPYRFISAKYESNQSLLFGWRLSFSVFSLCNRLVRYSFDGAESPLRNYSAKVRIRTLRIYHQVKSNICDRHHNMLLVPLYCKICNTWGYSLFKKDFM